MIIISPVSLRWYHVTSTITFITLTTTVAGRTRSSKANKLQLVSACVLETVVIEMGVCENLLQPSAVPSRRALCLVAKEQSPFAARTGTPFTTCLHCRPPCELRQAKRGLVLVAPLLCVRA